MPTPQPCRWKAWNAWLCTSPTSQMAVRSARPFCCAAAVALLENSAPRVMCGSTNSCKCSARAVAARCWPRGWIPPMPSASLNCSQASTRATPSIPSRCLPTAPPPENPTHKPCTMSQIDLARINADLGRNAPDLVAWALGLGQPAIVTTNFRPFEAVILHMVTQVNPDVPVVWMDNGYNPEATYRFADEVTKQLGLNLQIYLPRRSRAHREAVEGAPPAPADPRHPHHTEPM